MPKTKLPKKRVKHNIGPGAAASYIAKQLGLGKNEKEDEDKKISPDRAQRTMRKSLKDSRAISARIKKRHKAKIAQGGESNGKSYLEEREEDKG